MFSVDAQWIIARKDYQLYKKRRKQEQDEREKRVEASGDAEKDSVYEPEMDDLRCILYFHGGMLIELFLTGR